MGRNVGERFKAKRTELQKTFAKEQTFRQMRSMVE